MKLAKSIITLFVMLPSTIIIVIYFSSKIFFNKNFRKKIFNKDVDFDLMGEIHRSINIINHTFWIVVLILLFLKTIN